VRRVPLSLAFAAFFAIAVLRTRLCNLDACRSARLAVMAAKAKGRLIDPMLLLRTDSLPNDSSRWQYQLKFDGYRAIAFKTGGKIHLRSRNDNDFSIRHSGVVKGLATLPDETVIDGEVIAVDLW
jgi:ATP-dependent DNA ligase